MDKIKEELFINEEEAIKQQTLKEIKKLIKQEKECEKEVEISYEINKNIKEEKESERDFETTNDPSTLDDLSQKKTRKYQKKDKKFKYKNNMKSDDGKIEKWFLNARYLIRKYKKTEDKNSSYVITYEGKNKIKVQFRIRGPDRKFKCSGKLVYFEKDGYDDKWDMETGTNKMENFLNYALDNFEDLERTVNLYKF